MIANGENAATAYTIGWEPQPGPQTALLACPVFEVFFGGARGGGKTDGMLGEWGLTRGCDVQDDLKSNIQVCKTL